MKKEGLQRFTSKEAKFKQLLSLKVLSNKAIDELLTEAEKKEFFTIFLHEKINNLKGEDLDKILKKISKVRPDVINQIWQNNHLKITGVVSKFIEETGRMPTINNIVERCGISRVTISKHFKEYSNHPLYKQERIKFKFMADRVLAKVFKIAVQDEGNVKAARLYLEAVGMLNNVSNTVNTQNNFIQINQTRISQETIQKLNKRQALQIENILKSIPESQVELNSPHLLNQHISENEIQRK